MRKFLTCALCFVPTLAGAITLYYDTTGECDGWWLETTQTGCPASNLRVTKFHPTTAESKVFGGIVIGGETVVESDGTLKSFNSLSENTKSAIRTATSLDNYKQEWDVNDTVTANFDTRGGKMSGATSRQMARGTALPTITTPRGDGASFDGWVNASGTKVTKVMDNATDGETYTANWKCGAGFVKNQHDVCIPNGAEDEVFEFEEGTPIRGGDLNCAYQHNTGNPEYCNRTVIVHLHDQPINSSGAPVYNLNVINGNEGSVVQTLWCNRIWCYMPPQAHPDGYNGLEQNIAAGSLVERINRPYATSTDSNGNTVHYKFRGYFFPGGTKFNTNVAGLVVDSSRTTSLADVATGLFYPKNNDDSDPTGATIGHRAMGIYSPQDGINIWYDPDDGSTSIQGLPYTNISGYQGMHEIDVYGGWARECGENCTLTKGTSVKFATNQGVRPGQVKYTTNCPNGYHVTDGDGTYSPTCEKDAEGSITINYNFVNQYGHQVVSGTGSCVTGATYHMFSQNNYDEIDGAVGALRYLKTNGKWYRPNYGVPCISNVFGSENNATVTGYVCDPTCDNVSNPDNGTCTDVNSGQSFNYNFNWYNGNGYTPGGQLWGQESTGNPPYSTCKQLVCKEGYGLWKNSSGQYYCETEKNICIAQNPTNTSICDKYDFNFTCPSLTPSNGLSVSKGVVTGTGLDPDNYSCTYTVGCSDSDAVLEHATSTSNKIVCRGVDACTKQNLQNQLNQYSCFKCMSTGFAYDGTLSVGTPTMTPNGVASSHSCSYNVWCRTGQYANQDPVGTVTCYSNDNNGQTPCRTPVGTTYYYNITELINHYVDSCSGTTPPVLDTCPTMSGNTGGPEGNPSSWGTVNVAMTGTPANGCTYTLSCANRSYTLVKQNGDSYTTVENGTTTVTCSNSACNTGALSPQIGSYYCRNDTN